MANLQHPQYRPPEVAEALAALRQMEGMPGISDELRSAAAQAQSMERHMSEPVRRWAPSFVDDRPDVANT